MNVLKLHLQTTALTLLASGKSQREIERITNRAVVAIAIPSRRPGIGNLGSQLSGNLTLSNQRLTILAVGQYCFTGRA